MFASSLVLPPTRVLSLAPGTGLVLLPLGPASDPHDRGEGEGQGQGTAKPGSRKGHGRLAAPIRTR